VKVVVDKTKCSGHARCNAMGAGLYELDDLGYVSIREREVPEHLQAQARAGAAACPERAITLK
jgi:ferredoxin